jgi:hypothetical protein
VRLNLVALLAITAALPVSVEIPNHDSASGGETRVTVAGSVGRYALIDRGCEGEVLRTHPHEYGEAGLEAAHLFDNGIGVVVRAGTVREKVTTTVTDYSQYPSRDTTYLTDWDNAWVNPAVSYEGTFGGIGGGVLTARRTFLHHTGTGLRTMPLSTDDSAGWTGPT